MDSASVLSNLRSNIDLSPTSHHVVEVCSSELDGAGFSQLSLGSPKIAQPGSYYIRRKGSLYAWVNPKTLPTPKFHVMAAHTDSPNLRLRPQPRCGTEQVPQVSIEVYGSPLLSSWLDRDLSLAGVVYTKSDSGPQPNLVRFNEPLMRICQLAIHLNRGVNKEGLKLNPQRHLNPLWLNPNTAGLSIAELVAEQLEVAPDKILSSDLAAYCTSPAVLYGDENVGYVASARLDNLGSVFCGLEALKASSQPSPRSIVMAAFFDHEEVGNRSDTGAESSVTRSLMEQIASSHVETSSEVAAVLEDSLLLSCDGAHATHPNYPEVHDSSHNVRMNGGLAIKHHANLHYGTNAESVAVFTDLVSNVGVEFQDYAHRSDMACGTTVGPALSAHLGIPTIDIGIPQLAMHSASETAGTSDLLDLIAVLRAFWG